MGKRSRKKKGSGKKGKPQEECRRFSLTRSLGGWVLTLLVLAGVLYAALLALSRTEGFASIVRDRLESASGVEVTIGAARLTPGLNLVLEDVVSEESGAPGKAGVVVKAASLDLSLRDWLAGDGLLRSVRLEGAHLYLARSAQGGIEPAALGALAAPLATLARWRPVAEEGVAPNATGGETDDGEKDRPRPAPRTVTLRDGAVTWWSRSGAPLAHAGGIEIDWARRPVPGHEIQHGVLRVADYQTPHRPMRGLRVEWVKVGGRTSVLHLDSEEGSPLEIGGWLD